MKRLSVLLAFALALLIVPGLVQDITTGAPVPQVASDSTGCRAVIEARGEGKEHIVGSLSAEVTEWLAQDTNYITINAGEGVTIDVYSLAGNHVAHGYVDLNTLSMDAACIRLLQREAKVVSYQYWAPQR